MTKKNGGLKEIIKLSKTILDWLTVNYQLIYKGKSPSWLMFPIDVRHNNENLNCSNGDSEQIDNDSQCTDCRKDLLYILIWLLWEIINLCVEHETKGKI